MRVGTIFVNIHLVHKKRSMKTSQDRTCHIERLSKKKLFRHLVDMGFIYQSIE